jgi:hypothetical protein
METATAILTDDLSRNAIMLSLSSGERAGVRASVSLWVCRIGQCHHDIGDDKPPLVVVNCAADFLPLEQSDSPLGILFCVAHG